MSRNKLDQIKAAQLEAAQKTGYNPYDTTATSTGPELAGPVERVVPVADTRRLSSDVVKSGLSDYQAAMQIDIAKLSAARDIDEKIRIKKVVLPTYLDFVNNYIEQGDNYPNDVAVQVMIWLLDTVDIEQGLNLALHLVKQGQRMPAKFDRDMPTFLCDSFYDWGNALLKVDQSASPYLDALLATAEKDQWDVHPLCLSKLYALLAKHKVRLELYEEAIALCELAEKVNPTGAGVKKLKASAQAKLNQQVK
jgi:hypothetical protein